MTSFSKSEDQGTYTRREFITTALAAPFVVTRVTYAGSPPIPVALSSPGGQIQLTVYPSEQLSYSISLKKRPAILRSDLGIVVDGQELCKDAAIGRITRYRTRNEYQWRGGHSKALDRCNGVRIDIRQKDTKTDLTLEARVFDDGVAFRYLVPDIGKTRVPDEGTAFVIPPGSTVWYHDFTGHYEGTHVKKKLEDVKSNEWAAPPLTIKLPGNDGYAAITEGALVDYAGMGLRADGNGGFKAVLGHALPVSHPFELRYSKADIQRLSIPASFTGSIATPWRVVMIGPDLNSLVNCDIVNSVSEPPDKALFPLGFQTEWVRPGRAVWKYLDGGENTLDEMKEFSTLAGQLGFEYNVVEGFWHGWTEQQMRDLADHSKKCNVGLWFWEHRKNLGSPDARKKFFEKLNRVGVVGAKIDFFDHEAKEVIDLYQALLRDSAEHKILVEFHGANKPTGESRTWPNEMTREAIRGLEYRSMAERSEHNATLPFTRFLAGHADYTPVIFGERRRETSWAHQIATAAVFTSPLMIYGAHPKNLLANPAAEMIKSIPSTWDETIALPECEIGRLAAFARRKDKTWFLAVLNGPTAQTVKIPLSFLDSARSYSSILVRDKMDEPAAVIIDSSNLGRKDSVSVEMRLGGGFIGRFE